MKPLKAIIMAGGEGSRLRPLTCDCPKPMLRLLDRPLMEYALQLLRRHGFCDIGVTLGYLPRAITDYFGDGGKLGVRLHYYTEHTPLGTAGSVRQAIDFLDERFIVLSGDGITDIDLSAALRFHRQRGAMATLVLKKCASPQEYGMVVTAPDGRIKSFHEKPGRSDVYSDRINTGIYILEPELLECIPEGSPFDFGHDLFPALVADGVDVYGWEADGYWCDVGDVAAYLRVHADALDGKIHLDGLAPCVRDAHMEDGCRIDTPAFIAPGAHICAGARVGAGCAVGTGCYVGPGVSLKKSILLPGARAETGAQLRGCILGENSIAGAGAQIYEESVVGTDSAIGEHAVLAPGVKIWPRKAVDQGAHPNENIVWGARRQSCFRGGRLCLESPAQAARAAQACMAELAPREVVIGRDASGVAAALWHAAASGAMAQGVQLVDAGECCLPQLRHALGTLHADAAILVDAGGMLVLDRLGVPIAERMQRGILKQLERQDYAGPFSGVTRPVHAYLGSDAAYAAEAAALFRSDARLAPPLALTAPRPLLLDLAERAMLRAGLKLRSEYSEAPLAAEGNEIALHLFDNGEGIGLGDSDGPLSDVEMQLARAWTMLELGETRLILPNHATRTIDILARRCNAHALYMPGEAAHWLGTAAETAPLQFRMHTDAPAFALAFLSALTQRGLSLAQWRRQMPHAQRSTRRLDVPTGEGGRLLHALSEKYPDAEMGGGLRLPHGGGWAWLTPNDAGTGMHLFAESADMEAAQELCKLCESEIARLLAAPRD